MAFFFVATTWKGQPENKEPNKCNELGWFLLVQLPQDMVLYVRSAIELYQASIPYSEFDWNRAK
jgi:hypothetical protein